MLKSVFETPNAPILLLWKFTFNPDTISQLRRIALITRIQLNLGWQKNIVSSTNCSNLTSTPLFPTQNPSNTPFIEAFLINPANPSATINNKNGARGSPCLSLLDGLNYLVGLPFINTETEADLRQVLIHLIHLHLKPNLFIIYSKKSYLTEL